MNRREALQALTSVAATTGMSVTPVTTEEAKGVELVIVRVAEPVSQEWFARFTAYWADACKGTALESVRCLLVEKSIEIEFVRTK